MRPPPPCVLLLLMGSGSAQRWSAGCADGIRCGRPGYGCEPRALACLARLAVGENQLYGSYEKFASRRPATAAFESQGGQLEVQIRAQSLVPPYTRTATRSVVDVGFCGEERQSSHSLALAAVAIAPRRRASPAYRKRGRHEAHNRKYPISRQPATQRPKTRRGVSGLRVFF